jgi:hypothetical protein
MSGIFQVKELESKKKALIAESEVYRQMLKLEGRNVALFAKYAKSKLSRGPSPNRLFMLIPPLASLLLRRRKPKFPKLMTTAFLGWQIYQKVAPLYRNLFRRGNNGRFETEDDVPAANV